MITQYFVDLEQVLDRYQWAVAAVGVAAFCTGTLTGLLMAYRREQHHDTKEH